MLGTALLSFLLCVVGTWLHVYAQSEKDAMLYHYNEAHAALRAGDQVRAELEYKAFLGEAIHRIANVRAHIGESTAADEDFKEALPFAKHNAVVRLDYASALFDHDRLVDARAMAQSALEISPNNTRAEILLGRISFQQKNYRDAAAQFEAAAAAGHFEEIWRLFGLTYLRLQQPDRAQPVLAEALLRLGGSAKSHVLIATIYYYGDYPERAIEELHKALAADPRVPDAHYYLGLAYLANNEAAGYARAVPEFQAQLKTDPNDFRSHYMLGYIALQQHQFGQAEQELSRAAQINPADPGTKLLLGQVYSETRRPKEAKDILRTLTTAPENGQQVNFTAIRAHYMLGRLLQQSGQLQEGATEIVIAEKLRRELRTDAAGSYEARSSTAMAAGVTNSGSPQARRTPVQVSPEERERAKAFAQQLEPLIGEAYYNLARISALHQDPTTAAQYSARAVAWDPSLAPPTGR